MQSVLILNTTFFCGFKKACFSFTVTASYKLIFNLLNFPAGVVPVGKVIEKDEDELKDYVGYYNDFWEKTFKKVGASN